MNAEEAYKLAKKNFPQLTNDEQTQVLKDIYEAASQGKFALEIKGTTEKARSYMHFLEDRGFKVEYKLLPQKIRISWYRDIEFL